MGLYRCGDVILAVGKGNEGRLELGRSEIDALLKHGPEIAPEKGGVRSSGPGKIPYGPAMWN